MSMFEAVPGDDVDVDLLRRQRTAIYRSLLSVHDSINAAGACGDSIEHALVKLRECEMWVARFYQECGVK